MQNQYNSKSVVLEKSLKYDSNPLAMNLIRISNPKIATKIMLIISKASLKFLSCL